MPLRFAQADAVDDTGVIERVRDHRIALVEQRLEQTPIGVETGRVQDRVFGAQEARKPVLELLVNTLCAANEAHGSHAVAEAVDPPVRRLSQRRMIGQAQIVVRAQIDDLAVARSDRAALRASQDSLALVQALFSERGPIGAQAFDESVIHVLNYTRAP